MEVAATKKNRGEKQLEVAAAVVACWQH